MTPSLYKTIYINSTSEIAIEKSRFIAHLFKVDSESDANLFFNQIKKKYWNATHNCTAFILSSGSMRSNDDGEPAGTAGKPILEILKKNEICNTAVVITRYFGGIKLGTGGLIRAYSAATQNGIKNSGIIEKVLHNSLIISLNYVYWDKIEKYLKNKNIHFQKPVFSDVVSVKLFVLNELESINDIKNICNGNVTIEASYSEFFEVLLQKPI